MKILFKKQDANIHLHMQFYMVLLKNRRETSNHA